MSIDDLSEIWAKDSPIDENNLIGESKNIPKLHSKYYNMYFNEVLRVKKHKAEYRTLEHLKRSYYDGSMAEETLKEMSWKPFQLKVLRNDVDKHIQADSDIISQSLKVDYYSARANYLEDIIKTIHSRNFIIKNIIDVLKFQAGEY